jgi:hypothetical protein
MRSILGRRRRTVYMDKIPVQRFSRVDPSICFPACHCRNLSHHRNLEGHASACVLCGTRHHMTEGKNASLDMSFSK